jgi:hypothetical protein
LEAVLLAALEKIYRSTKKEEALAAPHEDVYKPSEDNNTLYRADPDSDWCHYFQFICCQREAAVGPNLGRWLIWTLFGSYVLLFGMKYKISWDDVGLTMTASGGGKVIRYNEITEIRYEIAGVNDSLSQSRPFRRIVIVGHRGKGGELIDVSLRHFQIEDIRNLLSAIRQHRPDLAFPKIPLLG